MKTENTTDKNASIMCKVNSVQEACAKCFAVHILKFEILKITWKNESKNIRPLVFSFSSINWAFWCFLFCFFHVVFKISNFNMWTAKHLAQASCTELTLLSCTETTLSNHPEVFPKSSCDVYLLRSPWSKSAVDECVI